jgi:sulfur transfer complex TusBCD TusB component (DsrH family)
MGLTEQQALQQFGTVSYTGWGETEAKADFSAKNLQAPVNLPYSSGSLNAEVERARSALDSELTRQQSQNQQQMTEARKLEQDTLKKVEPLTQPFREDLETQERERLHINKNFDENQKLVDELDQLLTEGNDLIRQQQGVTGLAAVRNPRVQQTMNDVAARSGVIEAVINARNGQIGQAYNMIDRSINAITQDRLDQLSYYETVLNLANRDIISLDEDSKRIAQEKTGLLKNDLSRAEATVDYIKELMINPETAYLMGEAGVSLNDSIDQINSKLQQAQYRREVMEVSNQMATSGYVTITDPKSVPSSQLITITDSQGNKQYYRKQITGSGSGFDSNSFLSNLADYGYDVEGLGSGTQSQVNVDLLWNEVLNSSVGSYAGKPNFSPAGGIGTIWTDGTGTKWRYTANGWIKLSN